MRACDKTTILFVFAKFMAELPPIWVRNMHAREKVHDFSVLPLRLAAVHVVRLCVPAVSGWNDDDHENTYYSASDVFYTIVFIQF